MSELPNGWTAAPLAQLGSEIRGSLIPTAGATYELYSVPAFPTRRPEVLNGSAIGSAKRPVQPGDVLLCKINPRINRVWIVTPTGERGREQIASTEYLVLRTGSPDLNRYLMWYLQSPEFRDWITLSVEGATGSHTRAKSGPILRQRIPLPPLYEQRRIVAAIEEQFSRLDAAEEAVRRAQSRLRGFRARVLATTLDGWNERRLGEISTIHIGTTPSRRSPQMWGGGVPWVSSGEVAFCRIRQTRETISPDAVTSPDRLHPPGTVLLAMIGEGKTRGQAAILDVGAAHNQNSAAIRLDQSLCVPEWLFYVLMSRYEDTRRAGSGAQQPALNRARVAALEVPLPPIEDQHRIVAEIERQLSVVDAMHAAIEAAKKRSAAIRHSILERAFRGELVPQDPTDEPASALLERIAAERAQAKPARSSRRVQSRR
jgi:type I restriction enzyme, S subunit